ncbi:MAG TPA: hypothetical protein VNJ08_03520 [Bacteriovoracaceae bacterium]|nr:hypothetical protein [Bacteriovoracaceae bacterium]
MRLGLIGHPIKHSLSPKLYNEILGSKLQSYDLLDFDSSEKIPSLQELAAQYDGINITSPYKKHFVNQVVIDSPIVKSINAINTLSFTPEGIYGTNTDVLAVEAILRKYQNLYSNLHLLLLGGGVMAKVTQLVAEKLSISIDCFSRKSSGELSVFNLPSHRKRASQNIIINACSRDFIYRGPLSKEDIFWDFNYSFDPHQSTIPTLVKSYEDGQEMLRLQALAAVNFWYQTNLNLSAD